MKIKLRKVDLLFSKIQRFRFDYTCQKCGRKYRKDFSQPLANLGVSHYYGRSRENTRFDDDNVTLLCNFPCHNKWGGEERGDYTEYMLTRLGQEGFNELTRRANTYRKRDDEAMKVILEARLKEVKQ